MKSIIICEGSTDLVLIQYFLEQTYDWIHIKEKSYKGYPDGLINFQGSNNDVKWLKNTNNDYLCIFAVGGCTKIIRNLDNTLNFNSLTSEYHFEKIVIISDRDDINSESDFIKEAENSFKGFGVIFESDVQNNQWNQSTFKDGYQEVRQIEFSPMIIPFEDTGAIETFLLNSLVIESEKNDPDKIDQQVIESSCKFIDDIKLKSKGKYLKKRRAVTKAKFDAVFVVMTPAEAFGLRRTLLRSIPWEKFENIQTCFKNLSNLCS